MIEILFSNLPIIQQLRKANNLIFEAFLKLRNLKPYTQPLNPTPTPTPQAASRFLAALHCFHAPVALPTWLLRVFPWPAGLPRKAVDSAHAGHSTSYTWPQRTDIHRVHFPLKVKVKGFSTGDMAHVYRRIQVTNPRKLIWNPENWWLLVVWVQVSPFWRGCCQAPAPRFLGMKWFREVYIVHTPPKKKTMAQK